MIVIRGVNVFTQALQHPEPSIVLVTTNLCVPAVAGAGVARAACEHNPGFKQQLDRINRNPNLNGVDWAGHLEDGRVMFITLPTKHATIVPNKDLSNILLRLHDYYRVRRRQVVSGWMGYSDPMLIDSSLLRVSAFAPVERRIFMPPPGCGNGGLDWKDIEPLVIRHLSRHDVTVCFR